MDATPPSDRPAVSLTEIEVTPEMIEAGNAAFWSFDEDFEGSRAVVVRIYRAMVAASKTLAA